MTGISQMKIQLASRLRAETPPDPADSKAMIEKIVKAATSEYCFSQ